MDDPRVCLRKSCKVARYAPYVIPASNKTDTSNVTSSPELLTVSQMSSSPRSSASPYAAQHHHRPMERFPPQLAQEETPECTNSFHRYLKLQHNIAQIQSQQLQVLPAAGSVEAGSCSKAKSRVQDAYISMAIMLCFKSLNKALHALHTAYHLCISPETNSPAVHAAIDHAEALLDITIRRLKLAQSLAELQHQEEHQPAAAASAPTSNAAAAAAEKQDMCMLPMPSTLDVTAAAMPPVPGGLSVESGFASEAAPAFFLQQGYPHIDLQEGVGSSWE